MATLPDLDTTQIGMVAFFNVMDHGASDIAPSEALTYSQIQTYQDYDNGIDGTLLCNKYGGRKSSRTFNFRIKTDGWIIVWFDRTQNYSTSGAPDGYQDIVDWPARGSDTPALPETMLGREINSLISELSNSADISFSHANTGLYSYEFSTANRLALINEQVHEGYLSGSMAYDSAVTVHRHITTGATASGNDSSVDFGGTTVGADDSDGAIDGGTVAASSNTMYDHSGGSTYAGDDHKMNHIVLYTV